MFSHRVEILENESALLQRAKAWPHEPTLQSLSQEKLYKVTREQGVDFATALLLDRFRKSAAHGEFIQNIESLLHRPLSARGKIDAKVVIVPGALYLERPDMGGDGRLVRQVAESYGLETDLIPLASFGSVATNAKLICRWLQEHASERMILVSLSKGGADFKMAMTSPEGVRSLTNVVAWVNVCGVLNGSRMANWVLANRWRKWFVRTKCFLQRRDFQFVTDLRHGAEAPLNLSPCFPVSMKILNLVGFPLQSHMTTSFSRFCHRTLSVAGPNDGTILLSDLREWPGKTYPVWGMDHYFRPEALARNLITAVLDYVSEGSVEEEMILSRAGFGKRGSP